MQRDAGWRVVEEHLGSFLSYEVVDQNTVSLRCLTG
jgi:hypothetical protein